MQLPELAHLTETLKLCAWHLLHPITLRISPTGAPCFQPGPDFFMQALEDIIEDYVSKTNVIRGD